jgi:hypothetical protein
MILFPKKPRAYQDLVTMLMLILLEKTLRHSQSEVKVVQKESVIILDPVNMKLNIPK